MKTWTLLVLLAAASAVSASSPSKKTFLQQDLSTEDSQPVQQVIVKWPDTSSVPKVLQIFFAFSWVLMLALLPFIIPLSDKEPVTKTQISVGTCMMFVLFGGFYLFTNVILFQSVHFDKLRPLTIVECVYFMSQVITTVGYGDITPAKQSGQVFVALYVLGALFIIANIVSDVACHIGEKLEEQKKIRHEAALAEFKARHNPDTPRPETPRVPVRALIKADTPSLQPLFLAFMNFLILAVCWVAFFVLYPGEGKTLFEAIYMSLITLSTVGLGAILPVTEGGMIFAAYWMLFGVCALGNVVSTFTDYAIASHKYDLYTANDKESAAEALRAQVHGKPDVTAMQFLKFCLLSKGTVTKLQIELIVEAFQALGPEKGVLDIKTVEAQLVSNPELVEEEAAFCKEKSKNKLRAFIKQHEGESPR